MKSVGKQLEEARLARNWTPELAARETKIKVDRLRDLEADDYTHFSSPTYARGFVRTYARALGLDEYKILRQLDNKLPEDETSSFAVDTGVPYIPEPSKTTHASSGSNAGLYIAMSLGFAVLLVMAFVLFEAYRAGVLPSYFAENTNTESSAPATTTNTASAEAPRAMPVDPNAVSPPATNDVSDTGSAPRALPVDPNSLTAVPLSTNAAPSTDVPAQSVRALPVDPSELTNAPPQQVAAATPPAEAPPLPPTAAVTDADTNTAPRALPVSPEELAAAAPPAPAAIPVVAPATNSADPDASVPSPSTAVSARQSDTGPVHMPPDALPPPPMPTTTAVATNDLTQAATAPTPDKRLILTASRDSFIRVTAEDGANAEQVLYASVLHTGQSVGFDGHKFSINVGIPAAIDITLDGVNYGPHSDQEAPETFSVESHQP